eukprot:TRINITY_DN4275_c0_g1_i1.p1 TRINITY_DN4275_c0_g1~~TRINITY_DN4275_c0_g1_i1.p1  ORF type:complete len:197 (+),score=78.12 TRINITY_DN4275_c0_g1_i1:39-593(+)
MHRLPLVVLCVLACLGPAISQSSRTMADLIEAKIHAEGLTGNCAACSAVVESLYKVIAAGEGHHVNDAGLLLPQVLDMVSHGFAYNKELDQWDRRETRSAKPEEHMLRYINDHLVKTHHMMVVLSPYYLQNERHQLHKILCRDLLKHCESGYSLDPHHDDIHEDYDLHEHQVRHFGIRRPGDEL